MNENLEDNILVVDLDKTINPNEIYLVILVIRFKWRMVEQRYSDRNKGDFKLTRVELREEEKEQIVVMILILRS